MNACAPAAMAVGISSLAEPPQSATRVMRVSVEYCVHRMTGLPKVFRMYWARELGVRGWEREPTVPNPLWDDKLWIGVMS